MALSFFTPKVLRVEVTEGIDLESAVILTGERITVGSGEGDTLRLGARNVVAGHLTFQRQKGSQTWEYFSSDRGHTVVSSGNPRAGQVKPGMTFSLGGETRLDILKTAAPADQGMDDAEASGRTVPLYIALPAMAVMAAAFLRYVGALAGGNQDGTGLRTSPWFHGTADIDAALQTCLASGLSPEARTLVSGTTMSEPDALFRAYLAAADTAPNKAGRAKTDLATKVSGMIAESHLLFLENKMLEASQALRRLEYVLPVGNGDCPILSAARLDLAILELRGGRP